jgi:hypothetical protein
VCVDDPTLTRGALRVWFCLAVGVIAAAIADPLVEFASNAGWLGAGNFTDHSYGDVVPALVAGVALTAVVVALRVRRAMLGCGAAPGLLRASRYALRPGIARLLPFAIAIQLCALFVMETAEQVAVFGHALEGTVWLGGPLLLSLAVHAAICTLVAFAIARAVSALTETTLRVIRRVRDLAAFPVHGARPIGLRGLQSEAFDLTWPVVCRIGERAPPSLKTLPRRLTSV